MSSKKPPITVEEVSDDEIDLAIEKDPRNHPEDNRSNNGGTDDFDPPSDEDSPPSSGDPPMCNPYPSVKKYPSEALSLPVFIEQLKSQIKTNDPMVKNIVDKELLIVGLEELNSLIGHERIKTDVIDQVVYAIQHLNTPKEERTPVMLHTILYGDPGVGKTAVGKKLAIIWKGLGFLNAEGPSLQEQMNNVTKMSWEELFLIFYIIVIALIFLSTMFSYVKSGYNSLYNLAGIWGIAIVALLVLVVVGAIWWYWPSNSTTNTNQDTGKTTRKKDDDLITVVSREDLVSKYLGGTDKKTKELLERNRGRVIFVDEAYSLIQNDMHEYGKEAIDVINRYMSEYPDRVIIIFAGYEKKMKQSVFRYQPGLESRFMWKFRCSNYNAAQLFDIFKKQIKDIGWSLKPGHDEGVKYQIKQNKKLFKAQARDTERLRLFAQMAHNRRSMFEKTKPKTFELVDIRAGIDKLSENSFSKDEPNKKSHRNPLSELLRRGFSASNKSGDGSDIDDEESDDDLL